MLFRSGRLGKNRTTVTNFLRLLKLPPDIQTGLRDKSISMGHARAILSLEDPVAQLDVFREVIKQGMSVREVEAFVKQYQQGGKKAGGSKPVQVPVHVRKVQEELSSHLSTRVVIKQDKSGKGQITISFFSDDDLYRIKDLLD